MNEEGKAFYADYHDHIFDKRVHSAHPVRRQVHREIYGSVLRHVPAGSRVLDAGCGEGALSMLMVEAGSEVVGIDYSVPNIEAARQRAREAGIPEGRLSLMQGDAEALPFEDGAFEIVVSNHVLEHLPDFRKGLQEVHRVTARTAIVAVPTCLNPCAWSLLGGDTYWKFAKRSVVAFPYGALRVGAAWLRGDEGVDEGYVGRKDVTHIFRFPWVVRALLEDAGFGIVHQAAQSVRLPYLGWGIDERLDRPFIRNLGIGTVYVLEKR